MLDIIPFRRRGDLPDIFKEMENMTKHFWEDLRFPEMAKDFNVDWTPRLDLTESEDKIEVKAELPGLERKDLDISIDRDILVIKGEKKHEKEESEKHYHRVERHYGSFYRSIRLPAEVKVDKIDAKFKDGVLTIALPKSEESKKRIAHIEVH